MANIFSVRDKHGDRKQLAAAKYDPYAAVGYPLEDCRPCSAAEADMLEDLARAAKESVAHTKRTLAALNEVDEAVTETQGAYAQASVAHARQVDSRRTIENLALHKRKAIKSATTQRSASAKRLSGTRSIFS